MNYYLLTIAYYCTRIPKRFRKLYENLEVYLEPGEQDLLKSIIQNQCEKNKVRLSEIEVLQDHCHLILELVDNYYFNVIRKIKGGSSYEFNKLRYNRMCNYGRSYHLWGRHYSIERLKSRAAIENATKYVRNNRLKHTDKLDL